MATCRFHEEFNGCLQDAWGEDPDGLCILHSRKKNKDQNGKFTDAVKQKLNAEDYDFGGVFFPGFISFAEMILESADFRGATFAENVYFSGAIFIDIVYFSMVTFSRGADFYGAIFFGEARFIGATFANGSYYFSNATFFGEANFYKAIFSSEVSFTHANFCSKAEFSGATFSVMVKFIEPCFSNNADFSEAIFSGKANFSLTTSTGEADFNEAVISDTGQVLFYVIADKWKRTFRAKFRFLKQETGGRFLFKDLSLAQMEFSGTDLRRVEFHSVTWGRKWWRDLVYDEILLHQRRRAHIVYLLNHGSLWGKRITGEIEKDIPQKPPYAEFAVVERLYRQLKTNYEDERDFKRVGDFHYGEMEMHRRGSPWRQWLPFSWHNLYRVLSGYGERPLRAIAILILLLISLTIVVEWCGLAVNDYGHHAGFWDSLTFILQKATIQRPEWPKPITWSGRFWASLSVLLLPGQAALFILALRNRLGRRR